MARYIAITEPVPWKDVQVQMLQKVETLLKRDKIEHFYVPAEAVEADSKAEKADYYGQVVLCRAISNGEFDRQCGEQSRTRQEMLRRHHQIRYYKFNKLDKALSRG